MKILLAALADCANISREGKLNVMGLFNTIHAAQVPFTHPSLQLVLRISLALAEVDREHEIEIRCMDEDGAELFKVEGQFSVAGAPAPGISPTFDHIVGVHNMTFRKFGGHTFAIFVNRDLKQTIDLEVARLPAQGNADGPATDLDALDLDGPGAI